MCMAHPITTIKKYMKVRGFYLVRQSKHLIWRDEFGNQIVTPSTTGDNRTFKNIDRSIKRVRQKS